MNQNFTPLDVVAFRTKNDAKKDASNESFDINAVFFGLITITLIIMAILLFILIQKKVQELGLAGLFA
ncbi:MAG: hypothetical protein NTZ55_02950 [Candidatus Roizmanbacteria bacterium]|nr:hypothetical protein [Candidatus Roizmanbacteria bacterium]MCX6732621.1 hypothetical protein [Candidatus Roizmanbacteria bacterium]